MCVGESAREECRVCAVPAPVRVRSRRARSDARAIASSCGFLWGKVQSDASTVRRVGVPPGSSLLVDCEQDPRSTWSCGSWSTLRIRSYDLKIQNTRALPRPPPRTSPPLPTAPLSCLAHGCSVHAHPHRATRSRTRGNGTSQDPAPHSPVPLTDYSLTPRAHRTVRSPTPLNRRQTTIR